MPNIRIKNIFPDADHTKIKSGILNSTTKKIQDNFDFLNGKYFSKQIIDGKVLDNNIDHFDDSETFIFNEKESNIQVNFPYQNVKKNGETIDYYLTTTNDNNSNIDILNIKHKNRLFSNANIINTPNKLDLQNYNKNITVKDINIKQNLKENIYKPFFEDSELINLISAEDDFTNLTIDQDIKDLYDIKNQKIIELELDFSNSNDLFLFNTQLFFNNNSPSQNYNTFSDNITITQRVNAINKFNANNSVLTTLSSNLLTSSFYNFKENRWEYNTISKKIDDNFYNFNISSQNLINSGITFPKIIKNESQLSDKLQNFINYYLLDNAINTNQSYDKDNLRLANNENFNIITNTYGFPNSRIWQTKQDNTINLNQYLNKDFILEKVIIKGNYSALIDNPTYNRSFYNSNNLLNDSAVYSHDYINKNFASNITFNILKEENKENKFILNKLDINYFDKQTDLYINTNSINEEFKLDNINEIQYSDNKINEYFILEKIENNIAIDEVNNKYLYILNDETQDSISSKYTKDITQYTRTDNDIVCKFTKLEDNNFSNNEKSLIATLNLDIKNNENSYYKEVNNENFIIKNELKQKKSISNFDENKFKIKSNFYEETITKEQVNSSNVIKYNITSLVNHIQNYKNNSYKQKNNNFIYRVDNSIEYIFGHVKSDYAFYRTKPIEYDFKIIEKNNQNGFPINLRFKYEKNENINSYSITQFFELESNNQILNINLFILETFIDSKYKKSFIDYLNTDDVKFILASSFNTFNTNIIKNVYYTNTEEIIEQIYSYDTIKIVNAFIKLIEFSCMYYMSKNVLQNTINDKSSICINKFNYFYNNSFIDQDDELYFNYNQQIYNETENILGRSILNYGSDFSIVDSNKIDLIQFQTNENLLNLLILPEYSINYNQYIAEIVGNKYYYNNINILTGKNENNETNIFKNIEKQQETFNKTFENNDILNSKIENIQKNIILNKNDKLLLNVSSFTGYNNLISSVRLNDKLKIYLIGRDLDSKSKNESIESSAIKKVFETNYFEENNIITKQKTSNAINSQTNNYIYDSIAPKLYDLFISYTKNYVKTKHTIDYFNESDSIKFLLSDTLQKDYVLKGFKEFIFNKFKDTFKIKNFKSNFDYLFSQFIDIKDFYLFYDIISVNFGNDKFIQSFKQINDNDLFVSLKEQFINNKKQTELQKYESRGLSAINQNNLFNYIDNLNQYNFEYNEFVVNLNACKFISIQSVKIPSFINNAAFDTNYITNNKQILFKNYLNDKLSFIKSWCAVIEISDFMLDSQVYFQNLINLTQNDTKHVVKIKNIKQKENLYTENDECYFSDLFLINIGNKIKNFYITKNFNEFDNAFYNIVIPFVNNEINIIDFNMQSLITNNNNLIGLTDDQHFTNIGFKYSDDPSEGIVLDENDFIDNNNLYPRYLSFNIEDNITEDTVKYIHTNEYFNDFYNEQGNDIYDLNNNFILKILNKAVLINTNKVLNSFNEFNFENKYLINKYIYSTLESNDIEKLDYILEKNEKFDINRKLYISNLYYYKNNKYIKTNNQIIYEIKYNINNESNNPYVNILGLKNQNVIFDLNNYFDDSYLFDYNNDLFENDFYIFENEDNEKIKLLNNNIIGNDNNIGFKFNFKSLINNIRNTKTYYNDKINENLDLNEDSIELGTPLIKITNENEEKLNQFVYSFSKNRFYKKPVVKKDGTIYCLESTIKSNDNKIINLNKFGMIADNLNIHVNKVLVNTNNLLTNITVSKKFINEYFINITSETAQERDIHLGSNIDEYARSYYPYIESTEEFKQSLI